MLRTPDGAFGELPGFPYEPHYGHVPDGAGGELRMAYVEAGPADGPAVLLLHGEPSWSYLYRTVMPALTAAGLRDVTLVGQDWGGLIGLRLVAEHPDRFARVVAANTGLPTGDHGMPDIWWRFRRTVETAESLDVGRLVQSGCLTELPEAIRAAYDAPFPDETYKAGPRVMPALVPTRPDDPATEPNRAAWQRLAGWCRPFLVAFADSDPITGPMAPVLRTSIPGAAGLDHPTLEGAGHFLQEDAGGRLGGIVAEFVRDTSPRPRS